MTIEIERKYLVINQVFRAESIRNSRIVQGFLNRDPERTVRVRLLDDSGILTVKGMSSDDGLKRFEWETHLEKKEAEALLQLCEPGIIDKTRYVIPMDGLEFEVDVFAGANEGLIIAEIELPDEDTDVPKPKWLGKEVTGDLRYYNSQLSISPFSSWG